MKVLWLTNILFPEANFLLNQDGEFKSSGGWMISLANDLVKSGEVDLVIATVSSKVKTLKVLYGCKITYYIIPWRRGECFYSYKQDMLFLKESIKPNIVHIHGTESMYGLYYVKACGSRNTVVSIQGVMKEIAKHCYDGLSFAELISSITISDMIHRNTLFHVKSRYRQSAKLEKKLLAQVSHVIGRTEFDKCFLKAVAPQAIYHHCNETLRDEFYHGTWTYSTCIPHSIFISQCTYPVKGLHQAVKAFPGLKEKYPDFNVRIAGIDIRTQNTGYGKLLKSYFNDMGLDRYVSFLGPLSAEEMKSEFLKANLFLSPSTIENSPNSVGEAQLLGVPVVASAVGGVPTMIANDCGYMYAFEDVEKLKTLVCEIFKNSSSFDNSLMRRVANHRHNKKANTQAILQTYRQILNTNES